MLQEEILRSNTKTRDRQRKGDLPIPGFGHHFSGFGINDLNRFGPLRMICFRLGSLLNSLSSHAVENKADEITLLTG
jgi:hypothetical protein